MTQLLTSEQMRALEQDAISQGRVSGSELMARAGAGVVAAVLALWPDLGKENARAVVLCGPGNNGGDGFVIARLLEALGWQVRVHLFGAPEQLPQDARSHYDLWVRENECHDFTVAALARGPRPDVIVDAVFGIGLSRPLPTAVAKVLDAKEQFGWLSPEQIKRVAVDCPSGLDLDSGVIRGCGEAEDHPQERKHHGVTKADLTVTFHTPKLGHYLGDGPSLCGKLEVVDIGLHDAILDGVSLSKIRDLERVRLVGPDPENKGRAHRDWLGQLMAKPGLSGHKYHHGHVMVFAGGVGRGGAGRLAARAALRSGAGLVSVICPPAALIENASRLDAIMLRALAKDQPLNAVADARISAFCLGPGMGIGATTRRRVMETLALPARGQVPRLPAVVLDADALTSFAEDPATLFEHLHNRCILTPHDGEFGRLFPDIEAARRDGLSKTQAVRQAAMRAGCTVLLKGADTVIANADGAVSLHAAAYGREAPWLATAGAGDVLAGLIAGLAAPQSSAELFAMAEVASYLHVEAARLFGPGLIAEDLPDMLPQVFRELGL